MKVALMLAGRGRRFGGVTEKNHKALLKVNGVCAIDLLFTRLVFLGVKDFYIVTGHCQDLLLNYIEKHFGRSINLTFKRNPDYDSTNNMYSMAFLESSLKEQEFILINGDSFVGVDILKLIIESNEPSCIAVDSLRCAEMIDSPGVTVKHGKITDLGRHVSKDDRFGYAIGLYKFSSQITVKYFEEIRKMLDLGENQAGFHDPLLSIFPNEQIAPLPIGNCPWTDLDDPDDIPKVRSVIVQITKNEKQLGLEL